MISRLKVWGCVLAATLLAALPAPARAQQSEADVYVAEAILAYESKQYDEALGLLDVTEPHPEAPAVAEGAPERFRPVGGAEHDLTDAVAAQDLELILKERAVHDGQKRLGRLQGEGTQPGAHASDEDDRSHAPLRFA